MSICWKKLRKTPITFILILSSLGPFWTSLARSDHETPPGIEPHSDSQTRSSIPPGVFPKERHPYLASNGIIYWPIDRPFWLRLATSPDETSESFPLYSTQLDSINKHGIQIESHGAQWIRWNSHSKKNEIPFKFIADREPPKVRAIFGEATRKASETENIYGPNLAIGIAAQDEESGVDYIAYSLDDSPYQKYSQRIENLKEGNHKLEYYAIDHVGYYSKPETILFQLDLTPPLTSLAPSSISGDDAFSPHEKISLLSKDNLSGVKSVYYKIGKHGDFNQYFKPISLEKVPAGEHTLYYFSEDQAGNRENLKSSLFYLIRSAPEVVHKFIGEHSTQSPETFISSRTQIQLDASHGHSKPKEITYQIEGGSSQIYQAPFTLASNPCIQTLTYQVKDIYGNLSTPKSVRLTIDSTPPKTSPGFTGPLFQQLDGSYIISGSTQMNFKATDSESGVKSTYFQIGNGPATLFDGSNANLAEGKNHIYFWSIDHVGNKEEAQTTEVTVDKTPPEILVAFSNHAIKTESKNSTAEKTYPLGTTLYLTANDKVSGLKDIQVSINGGPLKKYESPILFDETKDFKITIIATDRVENQTTKTLNFSICEQPHQFEVIQ